MWTSAIACVSGNPPGNMELDKKDQKIIRAANNDSELIGQAMCE
jgi:hypothetical protein